MSCGENCIAAEKLEGYAQQTQQKFEELLTYVKELNGIAALLQSSIADRDRRIKELEERVATLLSNTVVDRDRRIKEFEDRVIELSQPRNDLELLGPAPPQTVYPFRGQAPSQLGDLFRGPPRHFQFHSHSGVMPFTTCGESTTTQTGFSFGAPTNSGLQHPKPHFSFAASQSSVQPVFGSRQKK